MAEGQPVGGLHQELGLQRSLTGASSWLAVWPVIAASSATGIPAEHRGYVEHFRPRRTAAAMLPQRAADVVRQLGPRGVDLGGRERPPASSAR